jgi:hypothetical protein
MEIISMNPSAYWSDLDQSTDVQSLRYEWTVVTRPQRSTAQVVERHFNSLRPSDGGEDDDSSTPAASFFVDLVGEYIFTLVISDENGSPLSNDPCTQQERTLVINSITEHDIYLELTWTTEGDPNETDTEGTDVDLHFRSPKSQRWRELPYDCYYQNPNPDWGPVGPIGDPSLELDDVNGAGPEIISLDDPEFTDETPDSIPYQIGVHYYASGGLFTTDYGPSEVTSNIYFMGNLVGTYSKLLTGMCS